MTEIKIDKFYRGYDIMLVGHAGAVRNEQDNDLVCCAISTLVCTAKAVLDRLEEQGAIRECLTIADCGMSRLYVKTFSNRTEYVAGVMDAIICGLEGIAETYPEFVKINHIGGGE